MQIKSQNKKKVSADVVDAPLQVAVFLFFINIVIKISCAPRVFFSSYAHVRRTRRVT